MSRRVMAALMVWCAFLILSTALSAGSPELKYFIEVTVPSQDAAQELAKAGYDVAGFDLKTLAVGLVVNEDGLARVKALGYPVTIRSTNVEPSAVSALADYTDPQELSAFMDQVVAAHPDLAQKSALAGPLFEGQTQYVLHITKDVGVANGRPSFILDAQHHAREVMTPEIARDLIDTLTSQYATDSQVQRWVDNINIYVVGSVNPDGGMYVFTTDPSWRRNRHPSCGVDNNRNYPTIWGACNGSSTSCTDDTYRGTSPGSEPETQGMMQLTASVRPFFALSYHSYGEYLMYSYGCNDPDERSALDEVAQGLNAILPNDAGVTGQFATGPVWSTIYLADGTSIDTQYNQYGVYAYVIEVSSSAEGFQPDYATWRNVTVQRQRTAWKYFLDKTLDGAQIRGTVTDATTGNPLPGNLAIEEVTFTHGEATRHADANGHYHLLVHSGGSYHVDYSYPGYCTATRAVTVGTAPQTVDVVLGKPGIPQSAAAAGAGDNAIDVTWQPAVNADEYHVYRSLNAGGPYVLAGTVSGSQTTFHDTPVSGGVTYRYVVRAYQGCESGASNEAQAQTTGPCTAGPSFAGLTSATNAASSTCAVSLTWPVASARCAGGVTYNVYRSPSSPVTPQPSNLIASGLSSTSYSDHGGLASAAPYYYAVRAVDASNGADDGNTVAMSATPTGPNSLGTWIDNAGDTGVASLTGASPWSVKPSGGKTAPKVYATGSYSNNTCAALTTPAISLNLSSSLSFASKYDMETGYDVGIVEVATGPSYSTWSKLAINYPDPLSFTGNSCGIPTSGSNTVFSRTIASPSYPVSPYTGSLAAYANKSIKLRWRFSSDPGVTGQGWWVDDIAITNALIPGTCSTGTVPTPREPSADGHMTASRAAGTSIDVLYTPACGATDNAAYWGSGPIAGAASFTGSFCALGNTGHATFDPGDPAPGSWLYFVIVGQSATKEGSYGPSSFGERPEAAGVGGCDRPQDLAGSCP